ncbi:MAG: ATP-binding protein [Bacteroidetes bacterium]|nr:ATP-binding protein [Bacteroidota bacterium]
MNILKELTIDSNLNNLYLVQQLIEEVCDEFNINNTYFGNISVAITEAVKNAIIHGNQSIADKKVAVLFAKENPAYTFIIIDDGNGFDYKNLPDPTDFNNNTFTGTGIFLIKSLADKVDFKNRGNTIEISFFTNSINYALSSDRANKLTTYHKNKSTQMLKKM